MHFTISPFVEFPSVMTPVVAAASRIVSAITMANEMATIRLNKRFLSI
jgi:hypothetical protein